MQGYGQTQVPCTYRDISLKESSHLGQQAHKRKFHFILKLVTAYSEFDKAIYEMRTAACRMRRSVNYEY